MKKLNGAEILENNKLIAEFMGGKYNNQVRFRLAQNDMWLPIHGIVRFNTIELGKGKILEYYKSWDWLMPVVEKISKIKTSKYWIEFKIENTITQVTIKYHKFSEECCISICLNEGINIITTYKSVVEFIKWYNKQK